MDSHEVSNVSKISHEFIEFIRELAQILALICMKKFLPITKLVSFMVL